MDHFLLTDMAAQSMRRRSDFHIERETSEESNFQKKLFKCSPDMAGTLIAAQPKALGSALPCPANNVAQNTFFKLKPSD
jgi:hypothetical protein